jgi:hypothetical protein
MNYLGAVFAMMMPVYVVMDVTMICIASDVLGEMFIDHIHSLSVSGKILSNIGWCVFREGHGRGEYDDHTTSPYKPPRKQR